MVRSCRGGSKNKNMARKAFSVSVPVLDYDTLDELYLNLVRGCEKLLQQKLCSINHPRLSLDNT